MKWRTLARIALAFFSIAFLASIFSPIFHRGPPPGSRSICQSNLKQVALGIAQYLQDYDGRYPSVYVNAVATSVAPFNTPYGWADGLQPYLKSVRIFKCPAMEDHDDVADGVGNNFTDYYLNTDLNRASEKSLAMPASSILLGEGNGGGDLTDARYNRNSLPLSWLHDKAMPSFRHMAGANYAFADGHVKWLQPDKIIAARPAFEGVTFALR